MTTTTSNYGLFKYVSSSDANLAFNITSALNNNWDKLDTYAVRRSSTGSVGTTQTPVYVNSSGVVTACSYSIPTSTGLTATVSLSENGYIKFSNSLCFQWGQKTFTTSASGQYVGFNISFSTTAYSISATFHINTSRSLSGNTNSKEYVAAVGSALYGKTSSGFYTVYHYNTDGISWMAIGKLT